MTDTEQGIGNPYDLFITVMGLKPETNLVTDWWNVAFEFSIFMGREVLDPDERGDLQPRYRELMLRKAKALRGPHGVTLIRAYKARRYSWRGRAIAPLHKAGHALLFLKFAIGRFIKEEWLDK